MDMMSGRGSRERIGSDQKRADRAKNRPGNNAQDGMDRSLFEVSIDKIAASRYHCLTDELQTRFHSLNVLCCARHFIILLCFLWLLRTRLDLFPAVALFTP